jgi:hypothetical protein
MTSAASPMNASSPNLAPEPAGVRRSPAGGAAAPPADGPSHDESRKDDAPIPAKGEALDLQGFPVWRGGIWSTYPRRLATASSGSSGCRGGRRADVEEVAIDDPKRPWERSGRRGCAADGSVRELWRSARRSGTRVRFDELFGGVRCRA